MQPGLANCLHACKSICMMYQGYYFCTDTAHFDVWSAWRAKEPDRGWGWLAPGLASPIASQSPCHFLLPARTATTPGTHKSLLRSSTAPSVTPESRRGHPNCLAEPLAVAPWALLALPAHARRGLQLLAESLCGPRAGLLMSLALRLRWHWTRKSGPAEGPPEILPVHAQHLTRQVSPVTSSARPAKYLLSRLLGSMRSWSRRVTVHALLYAWLWEEARV